MDNATYDEVHMNETQFDDDETYSKLRPTRIENQPGNGQQRTTDAEQTDQEKEVSSKDNPKYFVVLIVATVVLLALVLASIALSVATYTLLSSKQSKVIAQIDKTNNEMVSVLAQLATSQSNISHNGIELVKMQELLFTTLTNISQNLEQIDAKLNAITSGNLIPKSQTQCGPGLWYRLIYINMTDSSQQCPPAWREYNNRGVRACGRPNNNSGSCATIVSPTHALQYSRVCGRVIGFQYASPDAFSSDSTADFVTDFDGINITYGVQHNHIWSYVAGWTEVNTSTNSIQHRSQCPCAGGEKEPPHFHHDNYYCEAGNPEPNFKYNLYVDDPLWDGQQCEGTCCNGTNSPPWFSEQLPTPTTDGVEVSICCDQSTKDEDVPVLLIEIYMQ